MKKAILISLVAVTALFSASIKFDEAGGNFDRINPGFDDSVIISYNTSIAKAVKSVVNISTSKTIKADSAIDDMFNDPFLKQFFGFNFGIPHNKNEKSSSLGSGVIVTSDGYIITNNHVVDGADEINISLGGSDKEYKAKVIGVDPKTDIAVIKIDAKDLSAATFADSSKILEGDIVFAIGNPFGVGESVTQGIVSALNKNNIGLNQYENFIQTDASINPGNSGGALVDSRGYLIGINSAILSKSGANNGIGFAIPSNMAKDIALQLIENGKIERGYIGVSIANLTDEQKEIYKNKKGALISSVEDGLPAFKAGLKRGDLIIEVDGKEIGGANDLKNLIGSLAPNKSVTLTYERSGQILKTNLTLADMENSSKIAKSAEEKGAIEGLKITTLDDNIKYKYQIPQDIKGVLILDVTPKSKAEIYGFEQGDIIIQIGEKEVRDIKSFNDAVEIYRGKKTLVWVSRNGIPQGIVIR